MSILSTTSTGILYTALNYIKRTYQARKGIFSEASPFYMIISAVSSIAGQLFHYLHRAEVEKNIELAEYNHSVFGLARLAGYEPFRGKSAKSTIQVSSINAFSIKAGTRLNINNIPFFVCGKLGTTYTVSNGGKLNIDVMQGERKSFSFTSDGSKLQSYTVVCNMTDNDEVEVFVNNKLYQRRLSMYDMQPNEENYILRTSITHGLVVVFGDGSNGMIPPEGSTITINVIETRGSAGNGDESSIIEWIDPAYSEDGLGFSINENLTSVLVVPPYGGTDFEDIEKVRYSATRASQFNVLSTKDNFRAYLNLFPQYKIFDIINADELNSDSSNVFIKATNNISDKCSDALSLYNLRDDDYIIKSYNNVNELEKLLRDSNKLLLGTDVRVISPIIRHYVINIGVRVKAGVNKSFIKNEVLKAVADFIINNKRTDIIPCSDIVVCLDNIVGVDTVTVSLVSELNEQAHINGYYYKEWVTWDDDNNNFETKKLRVSMSDGVELGIDNGDIVIDKSEIWILRGGFTDRFGQYYAEGLSNGLGCVNVLFI